MNIESVKTVSEPTLRRLPLYHRFLSELRDLGKESVSCTEIGLNLQLDPTQVRKDLEAAGIAGRPRVGYSLGKVIDGIELFLGWKNLNEAFLVGVGSMGAALLGYSKFEQCGLKIVAAFDTDAIKTGDQVRGKHVLHISKLVELAKRMHIMIGIITVPACEAQTVANLMIEGGIRAIWNFAPIRLRVPDHIIVHNEDLYCSLATLSQKLSISMQKEEVIHPGVVAFQQQPSSISL